MANDGFISSGTARLWETAGVRVDATHNRLIRGGDERDIEPRVMDVLLVLMQHHGEVVSRDRLIEKVWQGRPISDEAVNRAIFEIRKAFSALGVETPVIRTVRSRGYEWVPDALAHDGSAAHSLRRHWPTAALTMSAVAVLVYALVRPPPAGESDILEADLPSLALPAPSAPVVQIVKPEIQWPPAVRDTWGAVFLGRTERLLSHQNALVVRTGQADDATEVMALRFTLDSVEGRPEVRAELTSEQDEVLWNDRVELAEGYEAIGSVPERLVSRMMQSLRLDYRPREECPWPADAAALQDYFEARRLLGLRGESNIRAAIVTLQNVLDAQPGFAQAWSSLARAYELLPVYIDGDVGLQERARTESLATVTARKALEICSSDALAVQIAGATPGYDGSNPWIRDEYRMRRALALEPNDGELARRYAEHLYYLGMYDAAYRVRKHAYRVAPTNARIALEMAWLEADRGNFERAKAILAGARAQGTRIVWPMMEHGLASRERDWETAESLLPHYPDPMQPIMEAVHRVDQHPDDRAAVDRAEALLREFMDENPELGNLLAHTMGISIGRLDLAFEAYKVMRRDQYNYTSFWSRRYTDLRQDPRFAEAVFDMGMRAYWERFGGPDFCELTDDGLNCTS